MNETTPGGPVPGPNRDGLKAGLFFAAAVAFILVVKLFLGY